MFYSLTVVKTTDAFENYKRIYSAFEHNALDKIVSNVESDIAGETLCDWLKIQRNAKDIGKPAIGTQIMNMEKNCVVVWTGTRWADVK